MKKWFLLLFFCPLVFLSAGEKGDYFSELTPQQSESIRYIINTLGNTSTIGLLAKKKSLEQAGSRVDNVHPLRFFAYVMSSPSLRSSFAKINGIAWTNFVDGMAGSLRDADARNLLNEKAIDDFSRQSRLDPSQVDMLVKRKQWKELMNYMRSQA